MVRREFFNRIGDRCLLPDPVFEAGMSGCRWLRAASRDGFLVSCFRLVGGDRIVTLQQLAFVEETVKQVLVARWQFYFDTLILSLVELDRSACESGSKKRIRR